MSKLLRDFIKSTSPEFLDLLIEKAPYKIPKPIALQIVSGREGVNLSEASAIVFYNISFSATSYWQGRDRMTTNDRRSSDIYWLFANGGIEEKIYAAVCRKKNYTTALFQKDYRLSTSRKSLKAA